MNLLSWRKMILIDFCFAFSGALIYILFFNVLTENVGMPRWIAVAQLAANFFYGIYGISVFLSRTANPTWFRALVYSNIVYAIICAVMALSLVGEAQLATSVLGAEALIIFILAKYELRTLRTRVKPIGL